MAAVEQRGLEQADAQGVPVVSSEDHQEASEDGKRVERGARAKREGVVCPWRASGTRARVGRRRSRHEIEM
jgi:hypothetical protein